MTRPESMTGPESSQTPGRSPAPAGTSPAGEALAILQELRDLTQRLAERVQEHDPAASPTSSSEEEPALLRELPTLLEHRQRCLDRLPAALAAARVAATEAERGQVAALFREIQGLEQQAMARLQTLRNRLAAQLQRLPAARASLQGYAGRDPRQYSLDFSEKW
ncbi:MAG: hypothetical protein L6E13_12155 [Firmicutes bacterium]|nr:hypothetical protein [Bacillota bacterium]